MYWHFGPVWSRCAGPSGQFGPDVVALRASLVLMYWPFGPVWSWISDPKCMYARKKKLVARNRYSNEYSKSNFETRDQNRTSKSKKKLPLRVFWRRFRLLILIVDFEFRIGVSIASYDFEIRFRVLILHFDFESWLQVSISTLDFEIRFRVSNLSFYFEPRIWASISSFEFEFRFRVSISSFDFEFRLHVSISSLDFEFRASLVMTYWLFGPVWSWCTGRWGQFGPDVLALQASLVLMYWPFGPVWSWLTGPSGS